MSYRTIRAPFVLPLWRRFLHPKPPTLRGAPAPPPSLLPRCRWSFSAPPSTWRPPRAMGFATAAAVDGDSIGDQSAGGFFAEETISWSSIGVSDRLCRALSDLSLSRPSQVQAACIPHVLKEGDVIIAAETGSGKTYGYLVPLIDKLCVLYDPSKCDNEGSSKKQKVSLVLCPNVMLCEQVVQMANALIGASGGPLLRAVAVCGNQGWPLVQSDVLVSTPASLLNCLNAFDPEKKRRTEFLRDVKYVVFDEADILLCGSFQNQIIQIINMLRFEEKVQSNKESSSHISQSDFSNKSPAGIGSEESVPEDYSSCEGLLSYNNDDLGVVNDSEVLSNSKNDRKRVRKIYKRSKQYIFVAATLPESGKKTAGGVLRRMFPNAVWVSGNHLHGHNPGLEQRWIEVTSDTQVDALINAVRSSYKPGNANTSPIRIMVFANTVDSVESVMKILQKDGFGCIRYHRESSLEERIKNLAEFRENGGILVCTDSAARGLDVPNVTHVIQAEFASSAVDFLHRIGRTARAGQSGIVTSLYTEANRHLVSALHQAGRNGQPVESAFSRKRSFRNKLKKAKRILVEA